MNDLADLQRRVTAAVRTGMAEAWNDICSDTDCHPTDLTHGRGRTLLFAPGHWADLTAMYVATALFAALQSSAVAPPVSKLAGGREP